MLAIANNDTRKALTCLGQFWNDIDQLANHDPDQWARYIVTTYSQQDAHEFFVMVKDTFCPTISLVWKMFALQRDYECNICRARKTSSTVDQAQELQGEFMNVSDNKAVLSIGEILHYGEWQPIPANFEVPSGLFMHSGTKNIVQLSSRLTPAPLPPKVMVHVKRFDKPGSKIMNAIIFNTGFFEICGVKYFVSAVVVHVGSGLKRGHYC